MRVHQSRPRRECVGDLVQIDGSPHAWFEDRGPACVLIVYVDDATTRLLATGFFAEETTAAYMKTTRAHAAHGRPVAYYSDRHSVFRVNKKDPRVAGCRDPRAPTQAKGRVERANKTLQDRLVKETSGESTRVVMGHAVARGTRKTRTARFCATRRRLDLGLLRAPPAQADEEPDHQVRVPRVPGRGKGYRLRGAEVVRPSTARRRCCAKGASSPVRLADSGGGRQNRARARRRGEGGAAGAAGLQAAAGPSLAATVQARRAWRSEDEAASAGERAVDLWTSPADRRAPFGACGQPVDNALGRVAIDRAFPPRVAHRLPTRRAPLAHNPHSLKVFSSRRREKSELQKGTFQLWRKGDISTLG